MLRIGDLSEQTGVLSVTIRYYERIGLLPEPQRSDNGYRLYTDEDVERLQFVQRARALDFKLNEIEEILAFREREEPPCQYVMQVMQEQISEIDQRIHDLEQLRGELNALHTAGKELPEDVQMRECVCHLIQTGLVKEDKEVKTLTATEAADILMARQQGYTRESAEFLRGLLQKLAEGQPVTMHDMKEQTGYPTHALEDAFEQMRQSHFEFDQNGALIGAALTQVPTPHHFFVNDQHLYAWCALDTLFLPACLGETARVESVCPTTGETIQLTISPTGVESATPSTTALSVVIDDSCTAGPDGTFCSRIHFFASKEAAIAWAGDAGDLAVFSVDEAYQIAHQVYIAPFLQQLGV